MTAVKKLKRTMVGTVSSAKMANTIVVKAPRVNMGRALVS